MSLQVMTQRVVSRSQYGHSASAKSGRRGRRASRGTSMKGGDGTGEDEGCQETNDEEDPESGQDDEAKVFAPFGSAAQKARWRTGHQPSGVVSKIAGNNRKRRCSTSSADEEISRRFQTHGKVLKSNTAENTDDDYNAVDFISESDEEEPSMEKFEERMIIDSEEETTNRVGCPIMSDGLFGTPSYGWRDFEYNDNMFLSDAHFFDAQMDEANPTTLTNDNGSLNPIALLDRDLSPTPPPSRRVHFVDDVSHSPDKANSIASDVDRDIFPDLFMDQDSLNSALQKFFEKDKADDAHPLTDSEGSYWNLEVNEDFELEKHGLDEDNSSNESCGSSGYETDMGETTDEEVIPPTTITRPQSLLRLDSSSSSRMDITPTPAPTPIRKVIPKPVQRRRGPSMGSWIADPTKPIAVIDSSGKHMVIYPAQRNPLMRKTSTTFPSSLSSSSNTSPRASFVSMAKAFDESDNDPSDFSRQDLSLTLGSSADLMMPGLLHPRPSMDHLQGGQILGPPEAYFPFKYVGLNRSEVTDDEESDNDNDENLLNVHDFIDFGDESSTADEKDTKPSGEPASATTTPFSTSTTLEITKSTETSFTSSSGEGLLRHFDKGLVSAFRRNQYRHQALLCRPTSKAAMYGFHGVKGGRQAIANNPISPIRKRKANRGLNKKQQPNFRNRS